MAIVVSRLKASVAAWIGFLAAWSFVSVAVGLPPSLNRIGDGSGLRLSIEVTAGLVLLAVAASRGWRMGRPLRMVVAAAIVVAAVLRIADLGTHLLIGRAINLSLDLVLLPPLLGVLGGAKGTAAVVGAGLLVALGLAALVVATLAAIGAAERFLAEPRQRHAFARLLVVLVALAGACLAGGVGPAPFAPVSEGMAALLGNQVALAAEAAHLRAAYHDSLDHDPYGAVPAALVLPGLHRADVYLFFVESYGRTAFDDPRYAAVVEPTLRSFDDALAAHGFTSASSFLVSPVFGGGSWMAHGTLLSGLHVANQSFYDLLVASRRKSLVQFFDDAGYRTVAVMPGITKPWAEGAYFHYAAAYIEPDMGYVGPHYGWATMPDQYILSVIERRERQNRRQPLFVVTALISSHGPWEPLPPIIDDWSSLGDGRVFQGRVADRPPFARPEASIQEKYAASIDYTLRVLRDYITGAIDDTALVILVGDHQPAAIITGEGASHAVPIHVLSRDPALVAPFAAWGFTPGMIPRQPGPYAGMEEFRDRFLTLFGTPRPASGS